MEDQPAKLDTELELSTNANLCLLVHCPAGTSPKRTELHDTEAPFSLLAVVQALQKASAERLGLEQASASSAGKGSAERPALVKGSATTQGSAAQPSATTQSLCMPVTKQSSKIGQFKASAERLALTLRLATPLYDKLLGDLQQVGEQGRAFVDDITESRFFGSLLTVDFFGHDLPKPMPHRSQDGEASTNSGPATVAPRQAHAPSR